MPYNTLGTRNGLNIAASFLETNGNLKLGLMDNSQNIRMSGLRADGIAPAFATNASIYSFGLNRILTVADEASLMGFRWQAHVWGSMPAAEWRVRFGNTIHVGVAGVVLTSAIAA